jgi:hypothetical protein
LLTITLEDIAMKRLNFLLLLSLSILTIILTNAPIFAQRPRESCPDIPQVTPTQESREIINQEFEFKFKIPTNYRTERRQEENKLSILLRNPADVELLECCRINREVGCGHRISDVVIQVKPRPSNLQNIWDIAVSNDDYTEIINAEETKISNQDAVIYTVQYQPTAIYQYASFLTPNREYLVTISAGDYGEQIDPIDQIIFNQVVNSFEFMGTSK